MRIILCKDTVKREIETPFAICIGADDLDRLIRVLQQIRGSMLNSTYGWYRVDDFNPCDAPPNTPPRRWTE